MEKPCIIRNCNDVTAVPCPCGQARRVLRSADTELLSVHRVRISRTAKVHYHNKLTEFYVILSGSGAIVLNGERIQVKPNDVIMIPPGTRHALEGEFDIINIVWPPFDPSDEHLANE